MSTRQITIIDPFPDRLIAHLVRQDPRLYEALTNRVKVSITIDDVEVDTVSTNLLLNGGGEIGAPGENAPSWTSGGGAPAIIVDDDEYIGAQAIRISSVAQDSYSYQDAPLRSGEIYEISGWIKTDAHSNQPGRYALLNIDTLTAVTVIQKSTIGADPGQADCGLPLDGVARDWTFIYCRFLANATENARVNIQVGYGGVATAVARFDDLILQRNQTIVAGDLADGSVTTPKIADLAVTTPKVGNLAVTDAKIAVDAVTNTKILNDAITTTKILNDAITNAKILNDAITSAKIINDAITTAKILDLAVTGGKIQDLTITAGKVADNAIETAKLVNDAVTALKIAANAVTESKIATDAVTTGKIATDAVTALKIAALAVEEAKIATSAVTTTKIADLNITLGKLASDSVDTSKIVNDAITNAKIATDAITSLKLVDGSVLSAKANLALRGWTQTCAFSVTDADTIAWGAGTFTASDGTAYSIVAGNTGNMTAKTYVYLDIAIDTTAYIITTIASTAIGNGKVLIAICQNGTNEASFMLLNNNSYNIDAANIVTGSITANEIAAATITGGKIAANTVAAGNIVAGTITANELAADSVIADKILANAITTVKINALAITTDKIAAGAVTANEIAALTIVAGNIAADAITAVKIATDAITTDKLIANAVTSVKIAANTIVAGNIAAGTITATELATDSVVAAKIQAGAVTAVKISVATLAAINANMGAITAGSLDAVTITGGTITGTTIKTAASGLRTEIDSTNGVRFYNSGGTQTAQLNGDTLQFNFGTIILGASTGAGLKLKTGSGIYDTTLLTLFGNASTDNDLGNLYTANIRLGKSDNGAQQLTGVLISGDPTGAALGAGLVWGGFRTADGTDDDKLFIVNGDLSALGKLQLDQLVLGTSGAARVRFKKTANNEVTVRNNDDSANGDLIAKDITCATISPTTFNFTFGGATASGSLVEFGSGNEVPFSITDGIVYSIG